MGAPSQGRCRWLAARLVLSGGWVIDLFAPRLLAP